MQTIYDYNPTANELQEIGIDSVTLAIRHGVNIDNPVSQNTYKAAVTQEDAYFDIALLLMQRNDDVAANSFFLKIPSRHQQYMLGFDNLLIE